MNASTRSPSRQGELQRVLAEKNRMAAPSTADRERITGALRARLGASALPEGLVPAASGAAAASGRIGVVSRADGSAATARAGVRRSGWLRVVAGTGVVAGALGFVLGYGMGQRERGAAIEGAAAIVARPATASVLEPVQDARANQSVATPPEPAPHDLRSEHAERAEHASPARRGAPVGRVERAAPVEHSRSSAPDARGLSFTEVLERLQRANLALREGQASLALIQLSELDRRGGDVLREERETTRVLALCAIGDQPGARRAAAPLLAGAARSIYAPRLDASCAREGDER
jgi:hypothetical protein